MSLFTGSISATLSRVVLNNTAQSESSSQQLTVEEALAVYVGSSSDLYVHISSVQYYICKLFDMFVEKSTTLPSFPNFIELAVKGTYHMKDGKCYTVIYPLAKSLETLRPDRSGSLIHTKRMPMGLIEYCVNF